MAVALNPFDAPPRTFISYARSDGADIAESIRARLTQQHPEITLWLDRAQMVGGVGWWKQITEALEKVEILIMVLTPAATKSDIAAKEWRYARQQGVRVCPVFDARAVPDFEALPGWMRKAHCYDLEQEWDTFVAYLGSAGKDTRVPFMAPDLPEDCVARPAQLEELLARLLDESGENPRVATMALHGAGGFGKTTLASMACHVEQVVSAFDDGILWVRLGETPNIQGEITKLYAALTGERPPFVDIDDASIQLVDRLDQKSCLLVIDDVWDPNHLKPFLRGGTACARLITTRLLGVVTELGTTRTIVERMTPEQAVHMLGVRLSLTPADRITLGALADRLGEWPLLLKLVASQLRERAGRGDTLEGAIRYIGRALDKKGVLAFDRSSSAVRNDAIATTVGASLELFSDEDQIRCAELAVFRTDTLIPLEAAGTLWGLDEFDAEDLVQRLDSAALLEFDLKTGGLRLHNVLRAYFETQLADAKALHQRLIERWLGEVYALPEAYSWTWVGWHIVQAGASDRLQELLLNFDWIRARLAAVPIQSILQDYELLPETDDLRTVRDALRLASMGLSFDADQLREQLLGRIDRGRSEVIDALLDAARTSGSGLRFELASPSLTHPGGALTGILKSHGGSVTALDISLDGRFAVSGSEDWTLRLWNLQTNRVVRTFEGHAGVVHAVAFTTDTRSILSASEDRTLRCWDVGSGELEHVYRGHTLAVKGLAIRGDDRTVATLSEDGTVRVWELATKASRVLHKARDHQLSGIAFAADGNTLAFGAGDWTIRLVTLDGSSEQTLSGHTGIVRCVAFVPGEAQLVSGADDGVVRVWSLPDGNLLRELAGHDGGVDSIAVTSDGTHIVSGSKDKTIRVWGLDTGEELQVLDGHAGYVKAVVISAATGQVMSGSTDRTIRQWDIDATSGNGVVSAHREAVALLSIAADGRRAISGTQSDTLTVWDIPTGDRLDGRISVSHASKPIVVGRLQGHVGPINTLQLTADGVRAFTGSRDRTLRVWNVEQLTAVEAFKGHTREVVYLDISADGERIVSIGRDRTVRVWETLSGQFVRALVSAENEHALASLGVGNRMFIDLEIGPNVDIIEKRIPRGTRIAMSPDGERVVLGFQGGVGVWDLQNGTVAVRELRDVDVETIGFDATSRLVVLGTLFGPVLVWDMVGEAKILDGHEGRVLDVVALPVDNVVVSAARDDTIRTWDIESCTQTACIEGPVGRVDTVAIAPGGQFAYSVYGDTLVAFDLCERLQLGSLSFDHQITTIAVTPSGQHVAIGDQSGQVHFAGLNP